MSWLSELFGGKKKDNSAQIRMQQQQAQAEAARVAEEQRQAQLREQAAAKTAKRNTFMDTARGFAGERMKATGINDTYGIGDYYNTLLNQRTSGLGDDVDLASAIDPNSLYETAYNTVREGARRKATGQVNSALGQDYGRTQFGDTVDDSILDSILSTQQGSANEAIERARSRGILNEAGYSAAGKELGTRATSGRAALEDVGQGVLGRYRGALDTEAENLRGRASTMDLTDNFDIAGSIAGLGTRAEGFRGRMEGDIRSAAGNTDYFDVGSLLGQAAQGQGFNNPGIVAAFANKKENNDNPAKRRLVGSTGAF